MKKTLLVVLVGLLALGSIGAAGVKETQAKTSITLWDQYYRGIESEIMDSIVQGFEAENPAIKVVRETKILDDLKLVLKMSLESGTGPDVMQVNQGEADMGAMAPISASPWLTCMTSGPVPDSRDIFSTSFKSSRILVSRTTLMAGFSASKPCTMESMISLSIPR